MISRARATASSSTKPVKVVPVNAAPFYRAEQLVEPFRRRNLIPPELRALGHSRSYMRTKPLVDLN
jgi:hypothetical protein